MALDEQRNLKVLSERTGHADPSVTLRIYTHKSPGRDREVADFMGNLIKQALGGVDPRWSQIWSQIPQKKVRKTASRR